jgi:hypothetical protein
MLIKKFLTKFFSIVAIFGMLAMSFLFTPVTMAAGDYSDNFDGGSQQTWTVVDGGENSTHLFQNNRYELHTETTGSDKSVASYVNTSFVDSSAQTRVQRITPGDDYLAYLLFRVNAGTMSGYTCGVSSDEAHVWFGKLTNGVYSNISFSGTVPTGYDSDDINLKCAAIGSNLYAKVWDYGTDEPADWQINTTDNSYSSGVDGVMLATYSTLNWDSVSVAFDDFTVTNEIDNGVAQTEADANNATPVASGVAINSSSPIDLTEGATTNIAVTATVTDNNGCEDIESVSVKLYKTSEGAGGADNNNYRYTGTAIVDVGTCTPGGSDLSSTWTVTIPVYYYANTGEWTATITPSDEATGTPANDTETMNTLTALDVTASIEYGALALGGTTANTTAFDTVIINTGNKATIGAQVRSGAATAMTCTVGSIPVGNEKYHAISTTVYGSKTALTAIDATVADVSAAKTTNGTSGNTDTIGWGLQMPASGVGGSCAGSVVFTAI